MTTKLKTLKELREKSMWLSEENANIIKAEAIKWVKEFKKRRMRITAFDFKRFHDITEEDLK